MYECGKGSWIFLYQSAGAGTSKASQAFWQVEDVEAEVAELRGRGVVFEEYDMPGMKTVNGMQRPEAVGRVVQGQRGTSRRDSDA